MYPSVDWSEKVEADEALRFEQYAAQLQHLQKQNAGKTGIKRALHAKAQLGLEAEFAVLPDLPEHARVAFFAQPATYRAYVRFSNGSPLVQSDRKPDVRGVAIKIL